MKVIFRWVQNRHHEPVFLSVYALNFSNKYMHSFEKLEKDRLSTHMNSTVAKFSEKLTA